MTHLPQKPRAAAVQTARHSPAATAADATPGPRPAPSPLPAAGQCGPWRLLRIVGEGALAQVWLARPADAVSRPGAYALKLLRKHWEDSPEAVSTLRREALVGRAVGSPRLAPVLAAHLAESPYYIVMPWLAGVTLDTLLARVRPGMAVALWYARQVVEALDALHQAGWMHGDVKPANVHVSPRGHVTLLDLGFARQADESGRGLAERPVLGTPRYLAPEAARGTQADIRADLYSLGVMLFEMLAGRPPFDAADLGELVRLHRQQTARGIRSLAPTAPLKLDRLLRRLLAKQPLRRPQSPRELIDDLARLEIELLDQRGPLVPWQPVGTADPEEVE
jgi:serine/threonine protein kinase